jgi:hypothetical protein
MNSAGDIPLGVGAVRREERFLIAISIGNAADGAFRLLPGDKTEVF